jgi:multiple sugar transport system permease protein
VGIKRFFSLFALIAATALLCLWILFPIAWGLIISLKHRVDALSLPPKFIFTPTTSNYFAAFVDGPYAHTILNSAVIAFASTVLAVSLGVPAAYVFSRARGKIYDRLSLSILTIRMIPATIPALPLFLIFARLGWIDTYAAIILVHSGISLSLVTWIMKGFFDEVPQAIDDASILDGDTRVSAMFSQILPLCAPGLLVTAAFCFVNSWNEFFLALILTGFDTRPFTVAVPSLVTPHGTYWGQVTAIITVGLFPGVLFAIFSRRYMVRGLTTGAVWR